MNALVCHIVKVDSTSSVIQSPDQDMAERRSTSGNWQTYTKKKKTGVDYELRSAHGRAVNYTCMNVKYYQ